MYMGSTEAVTHVGNVQHDLHKINVCTFVGHFCPQAIVSANEKNHGCGS